MTDRAQALEKVLEIARELARPVDLTTLLTRTVDAALEILDAERGSVFLYDAPSNMLVSRVATGAPELRVPADRGFAGASVRTREIVNVPDAYADPRFNPEIDRQTGFRTRCLITIPLIGHDDALVGLLQVLNKRSGVFGPEDEAVAAAFAAQCAVAIQRMNLLVDLVEKNRMQRELEVARDIQTRVLPRSMPALDGYEVAAWSRQAEQTGGDIYDVIASDGSVILLMGDATGHGIGPALSVTQVRAMLRIAVRLGAGLDDAFRHINDQLADDLAANRFVTAFLGVLDVAAHSLRYHAGGQGPILHFHAETGETTSASATTLPLGMMPVVNLREPKTDTIAPGDIVALITDGIFEYENPAGEMFGAARVGEILKEHAECPAATTLQAIVDGVTAFAQGAPQNDDMTVVLLRRSPAR